ncbi:MAG: nuclear transport factor 2 family protein [Myxococcales bacterium]|nr:nuclear transport factor 2 family protein [Myxococcales bacterium]
MATTQIEISNIAMIRRGFEAFAAGDTDAVSRLFASDATWKGAPGILGGDLSGRDAIVEMFAKTASETDGTFQSIPTAYAACGDQVFVHAIITGKRRGRTLEDEGILVYRIAQELIHEVRLFLGDHPAETAFWS